MSGSISTKSATLSVVKITNFKGDYEGGWREWEKRIDPHTGNIFWFNDEGGSNVQVVPQLPEAVVEVKDFEGDYWGYWTNMLELCNRGSLRAPTDDPLWAFLEGQASEITELISPFAYGIKVGKGDLRRASKEKLLEVGLELKALRMAFNNKNNFGAWPWTRRGS